MTLAWIHRLSAALTQKSSPDEMMMPVGACRGKVTTRSKQATMRSRLIGAALGVMVLISPMPAGAQAGTETSSIRVPIEESLPGGLLGHPCGTGDVIHLTGDMHVVQHRTTDATGGLHYKIEVNFQGLQGVGLVSGTSYLAIRATNITEQSSEADVTIDITSQRLIALGRQTDFWLHWVRHSTYNATGELTAQVVKVEASCDIVS